MLEFRLHQLAIAYGYNMQENPQSVRLKNWFPFLMNASEVYFPLATKKKISNRHVDVTKGADTIQRREISYSCHDGKRKLSFYTFKLPSSEFKKSVAYLKEK